MSRSPARTFLRVLFLGLNVVAACGLLAAYLAGPVSPATFWPLAFAGLAYPVLLLIVILFAVFWGVKGEWKLLVAHIVLVALRIDLVADYYQFTPSEKTEQTDSIRVMSYNVRLFDFYNWSGEEDARQKMYDHIVAQEPKIICFQEFYTRGIKDKKGKPQKISFPSAKHLHSANYSKRLKADYNWGLATFSAYPIVNKGQIAFDNTSGNLCIYTDVRMGNDTVRIYNLHLQSVRIGNREFGALEHLMEHGEVDSLQLWFTIFSRLKTGFVSRVQQVDSVADHISKCPHPVILCGDFNDTYASYSYQTVSSGLKDAFHESGQGFGFTYARFPLFRIDNILYGPAFNSSRQEVHEWPWSDHYAVSATLHKAEGE